MKTKSIVGIVIGVVIAVVAGGAAYWFLRSPAVNIANPPQFIQHDFVDLSKIYSISKFRSGEGHDFSSDGETCRSMKHYFMPQYDPTAKSENGIPPKPDGVTDIPIYSPVDGTVTQITEERTPIGKQVYIKPTNAPGYTIRLFHIFLNDSISQGVKVTAGEQIGVIGKSQGTDIAIEAGDRPWQRSFVSYFDVMPDSLFAAYQARGVSSRDELIVTKEYRNAHPFECNGEEFTHPKNYDNTSDEVRLSGYVD